MVDCIIIGAGVAGLAAARSLKLAGLQCLVLEAQERSGGRAQTTKLEEFVVDQGAVFLNSNYTRTLALARDFGIGVVPAGIQPGRGGKRHALTVNGVYRGYDVGTLLGLLCFAPVPLKQRLRTAAFLSRQRFARKLGLFDTARLAGRDGEGAMEWGQRALGSEAFEYFARLAFEPFFFDEVARTNAASIQALLAELSSSRLLLPRGGMGALSEALARELAIVTRAAVTSISWDGKLFCARHAGGSEYAPAVIVAVPAPAAARMSLPLSESDRRSIEAVQYVPSLVLNLGYSRTNVLYPPVITPAGPGAHPVVGIGAMSAWAPPHAVPGKELIQVRASAARSERLLDKSASQIVVELMGDCTRAGVHLPRPEWLDAIPVVNAVVRTPPGHFTAMRAFLARERDGLYFAGDWLTGSTIEGAIRSGEAAARRVAARVHRLR